ncbi:SigE family RNA polymerase sigma factor [Nocardioides bigeumensis]|uniref:SigE family RNA polymerase sigma factor n=1 Tax=Nocardioides bigeumensis TaxID=433657 RepID=A0ABN2XZT8_9ACTN
MHAIATRTGAPVLSTGVGSRESHDADFAEYLAARQPALLRTAYALTGNRADAEDLLQTALAKLYLSWGRVRDREAIDGYVRRILVNENNSLWRRAFKRREVAVEAVPDRAGGEGPDSGHNDALWSFVQSLPPKQKAVVVLRYYEELSEAETADVLGISVGTVKSQASRALAALRERAPQSLNPYDSTDSGEERPR